MKKLIMNLSIFGLTAFCLLTVSCLQTTPRLKTEVYYPDVRTRGAVSDGQLAIFDGVSGRFIKSAGATSESSYIESIAATIAAVSNSVVAETGRATNAEAVVSNAAMAAVAAEVSRATNVEAGVSNAAMAAVSAEASRATNAEVGVSNAAMAAVAAEASRATNAETIVSNVAAAAAAAVVAEASRATNAEAGVSNAAMAAVEAEASRATNAEAGVSNALMAAVAAEASRATNAEAGVSNAVMEAITAEMARATNAEANIETTASNATVVVQSNLTDHAALPAITGHPGTGTASTNATGDFYPMSGNPSGFLTTGPNRFDELFVANLAYLNTNISGLTQGVYTGSLTTISYTGNTPVVESRTYAWGFTKENSYGTSTLSIAGCSLVRTNSGAVSNYFTAQSSDTNLILKLDGIGSSKSDVSALYVCQVLTGDLNVAGTVRAGAGVTVDGKSVLFDNAPVNGTNYGRKDGAWFPISAEAGGFSGGTITMDVSTNKDSRWIKFVLRPNLTSEVFQAAYIPPTSGEGVIYYVATNGNDAADGTNWDTAVLTFERAVELYESGEEYNTVWFGDGTWTTGNYTNETMSNDTINLSYSGVFASYNLHGAVINGDEVAATNGWTAFTIGDPDAIVSGFVISNSETGVEIGAGGGQLRNCIIHQCSFTALSMDDENALGENLIICGCVHDNNNDAPVMLNYGTLRNCLIYGNESVGGADAGAIYIGGGPALIENCTIVGNKGEGSGGLYFDYSYDETNIFLRNSIVAFNWTDTEEFCDVVLNESFQIITNSCIGMAYLSEGYEITEATNFNGQNGCITNNPLFISASTTNQGTNYPSGNFALLEGSPCRNTGANQDWMTNAVDIDRYPRIMQTIVDMGAYEFAPATQIVWKAEASSNDYFIISRDGTNLVIVYPESNVFTKGVSAPSVAADSVAIGGTNATDAFDPAGSAATVQGNLDTHAGLPAIDGHAGTGTASTNATEDFEAAGVTVQKSGDIMSGPLTNNVLIAGNIAVIFTNITGSLTAGNLYYLGDGAWSNADATVEATSKGLLGVALTTSAEDGVLLNGRVVNEGWSFIMGDVLYVSTNASEITATAPTETNNIVRVVGYAVNTNEIDFHPDRTWIELE